MFEGGCELASTVSLFTSLAYNILKTSLLFGTPFKFHFNVAGVPTSNISKSPPLYEPSNQSGTNMGKDG